MVGYSCLQGYSVLYNGLLILWLMYLRCASHITRPSMLTVEALRQ